MIFLTRVSDLAFGTVSFDYTAYGTLLYEETVPWPSSRVSYSYNTDRLRSGWRLAQPTDVDWTQNYGYDAAWRLRTIGGSAGSFTYNYQNPNEWVHSLNLPRAPAPPPSPHNPHSNEPPARTEPSPDRKALGLPPIFLNFSLSLREFKPFNGAGSFTVMRRDAENCRSCSVEQDSFETHS